MIKLDQIRNSLLTSPETPEAPHFKLTSFRVIGKMIASADPDKKFIPIFLPHEKSEFTLKLANQNTEIVFLETKVCGVKVNLKKICEQQLLA